MYSYLIILIMGHRQNNGVQTGTRICMEIVCIQLNSFSFCITSSHNLVN